jgi:hypothetical protein
MRLLTSLLIYINNNKSKYTGDLALMHYLTSPVSIKRKRKKKKAIGNCHQAEAEAFGPGRAGPG